MDAYLLCVDVVAKARSLHRTNKQIYCSKHLKIYFTKLNLILHKRINKQIKFIVA